EPRVRGGRHSPSDGGADAGRDRPAGRRARAAEFVHDERIARTERGRARRRRARALRGGLLSGRGTARLPERARPRRLPPSVQYRRADRPKQNARRPRGARPAPRVRAHRRPGGTRRRTRRISQTADDWLTRHRTITFFEASTVTQIGTGLASE